MERKQFEKLVDVMWDEGCSMKIMMFLEHDKQQQDTLARLEAERDEFKMLFESMQGNSMGHVKELVEAVELLERLCYSKTYSDLENIMPEVATFLANHADIGKEE